jgi:precorrin-3B synthase
MNAIVKGWCPTALRPMASGDGLLVRLRPRFGRLNPDDLDALSALAMRHGNGLIDLTRRGSLQFRGLTQDSHQRFVDEALAEGLAERSDIAHRILVDPFGGSQALLTAAHLMAALAGWRLRDQLPAKMQFAIGAVDGDIVMAPDGDPHEALAFAEALITEGRKPVASSSSPRLPGQIADGFLIGAAFGRLEASDLAALARLCRDEVFSEVRLTPWRQLLLTGASESVRHRAEALGFITSPDDPRLSIDACPGSPQCASSSVDTRALAISLSDHAKGRSIHISGCAKGCARSASADIVLTGRNARYDLIRNGRADSPPHLSELEADAALRAII